MLRGNIADVLFDEPTPIQMCPQGGHPTHNSTDLVAYQLSVTSLSIREIPSLNKMLC